MLAFIDEAGDTGLKTGKGSSRYFVVALVIFEDHDDAQSCDQRISLLRKELNYPDSYEFHFSHNSDMVRKRFLEAVAPYGFLYFGFALNKDLDRLWGPGFQVKSSLYKFTCGLVFENAKPYLSNTIIVIDESGTDTFRRQLGKYLSGRMKDENGRSLIKKVKMQDSAGNNLLQLADYVVGVLNRKVQGKKDANEYYRFISTKEMQLRIWPQ
ncbi:MAG: hypothetical protein OJF52_004239 [Nitrospira sp.]|jgi:hypothetical protein|nr:MAG: hypothetical protein OJF52_004239 [Nitrospira sp.]